MKLLSFRRYVLSGIGLSDVFAGVDCSPERPLMTLEENCSAHVIC